MTELFQHIAFISMPGGPEWVVILIIGLLVFGRKLPEVARNIGKSVNEFKKGMREFQESADEVARDVNKAANEAMTEDKSTPGVNDYGYHEPETTTSGTTDYGSYDAGDTSDAVQSGTPEPPGTTPETAESSVPESGATAPKQDEHDPYVEPMK